MNEDIIRAIDDAVCEVMMTRGPDGHVDGHDYLTRFIAAIARPNVGLQDISDALDAAYDRDPNA